jgi:hypothetical protein
MRAISGQTLRTEISSGILQSMLGAIGIKTTTGTRQDEIIDKINKLLDNSFEAQITDVTAFKQASYRAGQERSATNKSAGEGSAEGTLSFGSTKVSVTGKLSGESSNVTNETRSAEYSALLVRTFNLTKIIEDLREVFNAAGIKRLFVFIDDFSELSEEAMHVFVDKVLAPINKIQYWLH